MPKSDPLLLISPHLDDAVLSCGDFLAAHPGAVVVTVFAGAPPPGAPLTKWDSAAGFSRSEDVIPRRRAEDRAALATLEAQPVWLDFPDNQYAPTPPQPLIVDRLLQLVQDYRPGSFLVPMGLFHRDHRAAADAALEVARRTEFDACYVYEDVPYRRVAGLLQARLSALHDAGATVTPATFDVPLTSRKCAAIERYASQLRALASPGRPGHADAYLPERYWRLELQDIHDG
jgi:LmbE family N-acetylglucosaminyl deacetylase